MLAIWDRSLAFAFLALQLYHNTIMEHLLIEQYQWEES